MVSTILGQRSLYLVRMQLENLENRFFAPSIASGDTSVTLPGAEEAAQRRFLQELDLLSRLYCQLREIVKEETKPTVSLDPRIRDLPAPKDD
jgi:hypothetical protein